MLPIFRPHHVNLYFASAASSCRYTSSELTTVANKSEEQIKR
jgi:hypothetical protein